MPITIALLEDQPLMRLAIRTCLTPPEMEVRCTCATTAELTEALSQMQVDVVLVGLAALERSAADVRLEVERIRQQATMSPPIVVLGRAAPVSLSKLASRNPTAVVFLSTSETDGPGLGFALAAAARGERRMSLDAIAEQGGLLAAAPVRAPDPLPVLTPREREVCAAVGYGADNLKIATVMGISERTVKSHISSLYRKLHVENRVEIALLALREGLLWEPS